jgi:DHA3 family macrolide efflux protein-like MFS transporter
MSAAETTPPRPLGLREALRMAPLRRLWLAQIVSIFGDFLALFAVLTHASFALHATAAQVTGITASFMLPFALVGPLAGVFVDRWNVKRTMIASDLVRAALVFCLVFADGLYEIYALLFLLSTVSTFFLPAQSVTVRTIVPPEGLMAANALLQQAMQIARIVSPALAGAMVSAFGPAYCYGIDTASFLFSAAMISKIAIERAPTRPAPGSHPVSAVVHDLLAGVRFVLSQPILVFVTVAMAAAMFAVSCFGPLLAVYVRDDLRSSPIVFGVVNAMIGVGMIAGSLLVNRLAKSREKSHLVLLGLLTMGAFIVVLAALRTVPAAAVGMFGIGVGVVLIFVSAQTMMQANTPVALVGRVSASAWALFSVAQLMGLALSGAAAQRLGSTKVFFASAALLATMALLGRFALPEPAPLPSPTR